VDWIAAQADGQDPVENGLTDEDLSGDALLPRGSQEELSVQDFPEQQQILDQIQMEAAPDSYWDRDPDLWMYRKQTAALLRRYMRWSLEAGRLPSLLGRELFRAKITVYTATTFEDRVIFIHDIERCLDRLASFDRDIIARVVLQGHDHPQAARILHCTRKTIERKVPEVLDELSEAFLKAQLLDPLPETREETP
jgi:DNA-directed RNA polymerase specialized sigma24 family protein